MEIVVLNGSPRRGGNTDALVEAFVAEASKRHRVNVYHASDYLEFDILFEKKIVNNWL